MCSCAGEAFSKSDGVLSSGLQVRRTFSARSAVLPDPRLSAVLSVMPACFSALSDEALGRTPYQGPQPMPEERTNRVKGRSWDQSFIGHRMDVSAEMVTVRVIRDIRLIQPEWNHFRPHVECIGAAELR